MRTIKSVSSRRISKKKKKRLSNKLKGLKYNPEQKEGKRPRNSFNIENNPKELARLISERLKRFAGPASKTKSLYSKTGIFNIQEDREEDKAE